MSTDFGPGVIRTLDPVARQFMAAAFMGSKPPCAAELNLLQQDAWESLRQSIKAVVPSGFFMDPTRPLDDFECNTQWANLLRFGKPRNLMIAGEGPEKQPVVWACVNGWLVPVIGTDVTAEGDLFNNIKLNPPPASDTRLDFLFLEAWLTRIDPNPATARKPSASTIYKYGNVMYGGTNLTDDLQDPTKGFATTARIQLQYRLRLFGAGEGLGASVALDVYPEGLGDPNVFGQATAATPQAGMTFVNMREELGDVGLWRAGNGNPNNALGTVDGYTYAIPICAVFRRNAGAYLAVNQAGNPNHNGAFNRTPSVHVPSNAGARVLTTATLTAALSPTAGLLAPVTINITNLNGCGLEDSHVLANTFLVIEDEIIGISAKNIVGGTITIPAGGRGRNGTAAVGHPAGSVLSFYNTRPDGLYADQIAGSDLLDLRHGINPCDWDYGRLLESNLAALLKGDLRSTWKHAGNGNTQGPVAHEVTYLYADGTVPVPNWTEEADGPDGVRYIWSDAAVIQPNVTVLLDNTAPQDNHNVGLTNPNTFTSGAGYTWDVGAGFYPSGFMNVGTDADIDHFCNGSVLFLYLGGADGTGGARSTFRDGSTRAVRAVMPREYWKSSYPDADVNNGNQHPFTLRFIGQRALEPAPVDLVNPTGWAERHPGPFYPWREENFEKPFLVLGGLLRRELKVAGIPAASLVTVGSLSEIDVGINFDAPGVYYSLDADGNFQNDPTLITNPLLRDQHTLYGMLTDNGNDRTGSKSEIYIILYGDQTDRNNNGAWRVVGAGTVGYTDFSATGPTKVVAVQCCADFVAFNPGTGNTVTAEFRSQEHNSDDTSSYNALVADIAIVLTDIGGLLDTPWKRATLGYGAGDGYDLSMPYYPNPAGHAAVQEQLLIDMTLLYHPGRGGMVRVPDQLVRFAMKGSTLDTHGAYLRQGPSEIDTTFSGSTGAPPDEAFWDPAHVQVWNRLPQLGWPAPFASNYGGNVVGYTEIDREHELFFDNGSKTALFRPFRDRRMTLHEMTWTQPGQISAVECLLGPYAYLNTVAKDCLRIWTGNAISQESSGKCMGFVVPWEWMPRFGRQDIPVYRDMLLGTGPFLSGINHLFRDEADIDSSIFNIIGGSATSSGAPAVYSMQFITGAVAAYGNMGTILGWTNNQEVIYARRTGDINPAVTFAPEIIANLAMVNSTDFGKGLAGIQLPPYYGPARIYGIYEYDDYDAAGGKGYKVNRIQPEVGGAPNLLREDADQQTLFILQDGAKDWTGEDGDHTYIIPYNAIDITRSNHYAPGDTPADHHYVVECCIFGFSRGFIDKNNFVLVRKYNGKGEGYGSVAENADGDDNEVRGLHMVLPCPAGNNDQLYSAYNRTVYQGDPYMSRNGVKTDNDYENRYGELSILAQYAMRMPIEQYDAFGNFVPETPNARPFEVLASMDFYTTMGTGKIGGQLYPGTPLDVCYTEATFDSSVRHMEDTGVTWRIIPRAFTEGQKTNTSRASLDLTILDNDGLNPSGTTHAFVRFGLLDGTTVDLHAAKAVNVAAITAYYAGLVPPVVLTAQDFFLLDETHTSRELTTSHAFPASSCAVGSSVTTMKALVGTAVGDAVIVNMDLDPALYGQISLAGWVDTADQVKFMVTNTWPIMPYELTAAADAVQDHPFGVLVTVIAHTSALVATQVFIEADPALTQQFVVVPLLGANITGIVYHGLSTVAGQVSIYATNTTAANIDIPMGAVIRTAILSEQVAATHVVDLNGAIARIKVIKTDVGTGLIERTAANLAAAITAHPDLARSVTGTNYGSNQVHVESVPVGAEGNGITVETQRLGSTLNIWTVLRLDALHDNQWPLHDNQWPRGVQMTKSALIGGVDIPMNAGDGTSQVRITGMIERLPLGALLQDSVFLCENPLNDDASAVKSSPAGPRPIQTVMPLTATGGEYSRFMGEPGDLFSLSEGTISVTSFGAWRQVNEGGGGPLGTRRYRIFRGGGPLFTLSGELPGGPVDWASETFPSVIQPVLKGGLLACRAMLVRNYPEDVTAVGGSYKVSDGDEIQMVILTQGILGDGHSQTEGLSLGGEVSPSGYGEGWASADRYRLKGKPLFRGYNRSVLDPTTVTLVVYPDQQRY